jgi:2-furoate---CoA ligase
MPLYHTMGVRSLLAMSLDRRRLRLPAALRCCCRAQADRRRTGHQSLSGADALSRSRPSPAVSASDVGSVRKLGFAGAPMTDGLLKKLQAAFKPDLFVNHYGSSEIYTFTIEQNAPAKPGSAGRAGINQMVRVVKLGAKSVEELAGVGEEGEIIALWPATNPSKAIGGARRRRQGAAGRLVFYRRHRLLRRRRRHFSSPAASTT